jgi:membrane-associated phospholipid phosphatase
VADGAVPIAKTWVFVVFVIMRFIQVGAVVGALLVAPVVLSGASTAHAETGGSDGYARCLGGDAKPPPPGVDADVWFPSVHVITTDFDGGIPAAQIVQVLEGMGVAPADAVKRVQCFVANQPRGLGH